MKNWWNKRNKLFSRLGGEDFTNGQVILTHIALVGVFCVCILADWIGGI